MSFSKSTLELMRKAGWSEDYRWDTSEYVSRFEAANNPPPESVKQFLERFGDIIIRLTYDIELPPNFRQSVRRRTGLAWLFHAVFPPKPKPPITTIKGQTVIDFRALMEIKGEDQEMLSDWFPAYSARIGAKKLYPIGTSNHAPEMMMDSSGNVYGAFDQYFWILGNTPEEAIENLIARRWGEEIPELNDPETEG
jgi:hypothetical protein